MREHPIIFNSDMVRATRDKRKTQTRRVITPQIPEEYWLKGLNEVFTTLDHKATFTFERKRSPAFIQVPCPYGKIGDRLWVRESFGHPNHYHDRHGRITYAYAERHLLYKADYPQAKHPEDVDQDKGYVWNRGWRPSIHMPKWAARIWLEITDIRVERVQDISAADCVLEGCPPLNPDDRFEAAGEAIVWFHDLWDSINAKRGVCKTCRGSQLVKGWSGTPESSLQMTGEDCPDCDGPTGYSWESNPWVRAIEFKLIEKGGNK